MIQYFVYLYFSLFDLPSLPQHLLYSCIVCAGIRRLYTDASRLLVAASVYHTCGFLLIITFSFIQLVLFCSTLFYPYLPS
jgi:hypothetical protein